MHQKHIPYFLLKLQDEIMSYSPQSLERALFHESSASKPSPFGFMICSSLVKDVTMSNLLQVNQRELYQLAQEDEVGPPFPQAWLKEGDLVEASESSDMSGKWLFVISHLMSISLRSPFSPP
jgi:hypothetical protein